MHSVAGPSQFSCFCLPVLPNNLQRCCTLLGTAPCLALLKFTLLNVYVLPLTLSSEVPAVIPFSFMLSGALSIPPLVLRAPNRAGPVTGALDSLSEEEGHQCNYCRWDSAPLGHFHCWMQTLSWTSTEVEKVYLDMVQERSYLEEWYKNIWVLLVITWKHEGKHQFSSFIYCWFPAEIKLTAL